MKYCQALNLASFEEVTGIERVDKAHVGIY
jgi:hypothetical protein